MNAPKIAVIGWDAATFDVLFPLLQAGALPNLERLMNQGVWGQLESTVHPLSPTAWASFMTGMNPGKHAIFDFVGMDEDAHFRITNGGAIKAETLWARLSKAGRRVAVINVPMTFPPEPVEGFVIAGMDAPRQDRAFTYPPELADELHRHFGGYREGVRARAHIWTSEKRFTARYVDGLCSVTRLHGDVACYLLEHHAIDFLMIVFTGPDRVQHALGHLLANGVTPEDGIGRVYRACDSALGHILEKLGDDWIKLVMSDHGARAYQRVFELGTWLETNRWLQLRPVSRLDQLAENIAPARRLLARLTRRPARVKSHLEQFINRIVWQETRAFALGAFGSIYINTRDRFPGGIVKESEYQAICEQIKENLLAARDPETEAPIVRAVHYAREIYRGPYVHLAPDLLLDTTDDYFVRNNLDHKEGALTYAAGRYRGRSLAHRGKHTLDGILVAAGAPFVAEGNRDGARIIDVASTILYLNGLPLPHDSPDSGVDGVPLLDWLDPAYCQAHPINWAAPQPMEKAERDEAFYSEQDAADVEARLRALGYVE